MPALEVMRTRRHVAAARVFLDRKAALGGAGAAIGAGRLLLAAAQGVEVLVSLTEDRPRRDWADDAGLLVFHEPLEDMEAPTQEQLDRIVSAMSRAMDLNKGVAVHCGAGLGRTGVVLAAYFVARGRRPRTPSPGFAGCGPGRSRRTSRPRRSNTTPGGRSGEGEGKG